MLTTQLLILLLHFLKCQTIQPNIIFIVADDLGWNDVSFHGSKQIPTPNIDVLAHDGIILNNYYITPLCTPSRGSLMTGKYATRLGLQHGVIETNEPWGLPLKEKMIPEYLKELNYVTHGIGKWHLGFFKKEYIPTNRGFDSFFGIWTGQSDYFTHISKEEKRNISGYDLHDNEDIAGQNYIGQYGTDLFTRKATDIIRNHSYEKPLYMHLAHQAAHTGNEDGPLQVTLRYTDSFLYINDSDRRNFAGIVSALDDSIGEILLSLEEANVLNNTIIVFTADNGAAVKGLMGGTGSNYPLRGAKFTVWEGSTRGVAYIWSSELRKKSRVLDGLMHISDWLPTLYAAAGGNANNLKDLDGCNQWPAISRGGSSCRNQILYNIDPVWNFAAVRKDQYKLIFGTFQNGTYDWWFNGEGKNIPESELGHYFAHDLGRLKTHINFSLFMENSLVSKILAKNYGAHVSEKLFSQRDKKLLVDCQLEKQHIVEPCKPTTEPCLFDVVNDPCEFNNLANRLPEVVDELKILLSSYEQKSVPPLNKPPDPLGDPRLYNNCFVPWQSEPWILDSLPTGG